MNAAETPRLPRVPERYRDPFAPEAWACDVSKLAPAMGRDEAQLSTFAESHMEGDPLADELVTWLVTDTSSQARPLFEQALLSGLATIDSPPPALRAFFQEIERVPAWLDRAQIALASALFHRTYPGGERVLFSASLLAGYVSAGVAKTLVATGAFERMAPRRAAETQKFICDVYGPGGMTRTSEGFITTVRVRVMHAMVRRQLLARGFDAARWGIPINQADMAATALQFSITYVIGQRGLGINVSARAATAVLHLWRYVGTLMGVRSELLPSTEGEARQQLRLSVGSQTGPDGDSRALAAALLAIELTPQGGKLSRLFDRGDMSFRAALARLALGRAAADALALPNTRWRFAVLAIIPIVFAAECLRRCVPYATALAIRSGRRFAERGLGARLGGHKPSYQPHKVPERAPNVPL